MQSFGGNSCSRNNWRLVGEHRSLKKLTFNQKLLHGISLDQLPKLFKISLRCLDLSRNVRFRTLSLIIVH